MAFTLASGLWIGAAVCLVLTIGLAIGAATWSPAKPVGPSPSVAGGLAVPDPQSDVRLFLGYAPWCPACKQVHPLFEQMRATFGDKIVIKNAGDKPQQSWFRTHRFHNVPVIAVIRVPAYDPESQKVIAQYKGIKTKQAILAFAKQHGW